MDQSGKEFFKQRYGELGGNISPVKIKPCIRVNTIRKSDVIERLTKSGVSLSEVPFLKDAYHVQKSVFSVGSTTEHLLGYFYVQSAVAQIPAVILDPRPSDVVLDMCAAPGGKCAQLAALMKNKGTLIAFELKRERIAALITNLERCGVKNCAAFLGDASRSRKFKTQFDKVLLDAPCSGNYVTDPDWFQRRTLDGIKRSASIQKRLLRIATEVLKPGGTLVYSTCSLDPVENELNIQWVLDNLPVNLVETNIELGEPGLTAVFGQELDQNISKCRRFWPHKTKTEGFFIAKMVRV